MQLLARWNAALWTLLPPLVLLVGLVYTVGSRFFPLRRAGLWLRETAGSLFRREDKKGDGLSPRQALAASLAATIGTGSVAGVAAALWLGGPGAVFWMWIAAGLGMMTGCGEKLLAVRYQQVLPGGGRRGGPMYYLRDGCRAPWLAKGFALACLPATLVGGGMIQSAAIASSLSALWGLDRRAAGLGAALLAWLILRGGLSRTARVASALVPGMALLYLGVGGTVLVLRRECLLPALRAIVAGAFSPAAALGGGAGWSLASALRAGLARGIFASEAGLGPSAMAHGAARADHPAQQGMWGIFEVFVSTFLVCTTTALVILVSGLWPPARCPDGMALASAAFGAVLGPAGQGAVSGAMLLFAFSSILGWGCYGAQSLEFLTGGAGLPLYRALLLAAVFAGAVLAPDGLWQWVDLTAGLMALPNLAALLVLAPEALGLLREWESLLTRR